MNLQNAHKEMVEWMDAFGQDTPEEACIPPIEILKLRTRLIEEEVKEEVLPALDGLVYSRGEYKKIDNFLETLDGLGDSLFVIIGTFVALGVDTQQVWNEILKSNWTKFWTSKEIQQLGKEYKAFKVVKTETQYDINLRCWLVKDSIGKIIKSPSFTPPNLVKFLPKELQQ